MGTKILIENLFIACVAEYIGRALRRNCPKLDGHFMTSTFAGVQQGVRGQQRVTVTAEPRLSPAAANVPTLQA